MKYYVVSDVHSYYDELISSLKENGFFDDFGSKKLIVCGDMMDRGDGSVKMQAFMSELLERDELIFIRGNHEDLMLDMIKEIEIRGVENVSPHHIQNRTLKTALDLTKMGKAKATLNPEDFLNKLKSSPYIKKLIPKSVDYFEVGDYIFVHGWIPCITEDMPIHYTRGRTYKPNPNWREATQKDWGQARWFNGMALCELHNIKEAGKTIVCGHWHTSYGHSQLMNKCSEFGEDAIFDPFIGKNIIAIDACTAHSHKVNCLVIEG